MDVRLPRLGEGAHSGTVVKILVRVGDVIVKDQHLLEIESEKAIVPIPSPASGRVVRIDIREGDEVRVGQVILGLEESAAGAEVAVRPAGPPQTLSTAPEPLLERAAIHPERSGIGPPAPPSVRRIARELGIDLANVAGSGRGGRISVADLRLYVSNLQRRAEPAGAAPPSDGPSEPVDFLKWGPVTRKKMSPLRRTVAERMRQSWMSIPHVTQFDRADITRLLGLRKTFSPEYEKRGARLTLSCFILKACVSALKKFPILNSSMDESAGDIVFKDYFHLNVAVDTESGLMAPVIRNVDRRHLLDLCIELRSLTERTRQRKIGLEELQGGTFTVSNLGGIGGTYFSPLISRPQVAVLAVGRGFEEPRIVGGKLESVSILPIGVSYDHRVIDGADGARFIRAVADALEQFREDDVKL
ncbi:MAG: 2-oxo acid dehydrogenase subunit E2 [Nitrospirae bacterium]|nr:2-oxo acid dehydrogenase subunit E2 [Nitrospirota bacterium]